LDSSYGLVSYHFDPNGQFDHIKLPGTEIVLDRKQVKGMETVYANLEGVVWYDGEYCLKITDYVENSYINILSTRDDTEHHAISAMNNGDLVLERDFNLVPVENLGAAPGLKYDLSNIQNYRNFVDDFGRICVFKDARVEDTGINYVNSIMALADIQNMQGYDIPLLL